MSTIDLLPQTVIPGSW